MVVQSRNITSFKRHKQREKGKMSKPETKAPSYRSAFSLPTAISKYSPWAKLTPQRGNGWCKCEQKCQYYMWGSATSLPLQQIYPHADLPFVTMTPFTPQNISITYLAYKLKKTVNVVPWPCLLDFIQHCCQYSWHKWIKGNPTVLLATEILQFLRSWKTTWYLKPSPIHLYFRLTWHSEVTDQAERFGFVCLLLAQRSVSRYHTISQMLHCWLRHRMGFSKYLKNAHPRWKEHLYPQPRSEFCLASIAGRDRKSEFSDSHVCVLSHRHLTEGKRHTEP